MLSLFLLRHGETEFSRQDRFCGNIDAELTESGHQMAQAFAEAHDALPWQAIYTSTRERTISSANPLATRTGIEPVRAGDLDEIDYGDWQGRSKDEIAAADGAYYRQWLENPTIGAPRGETAFDVARRTMVVIDQIRSRHASGPVLMVAHKTVLRILICLLTGIPLRRYRELPQPVAALTVIDVRQGGPTLRLLADTSHLPPHLRSDDSARVVMPAPLRLPRATDSQPQAA